MAATLSNVQLAQSLPPRLLHFFQRYPPAVYKGWQVAPGPGPNRNALPVSDALQRLNRPDGTSLETDELRNQSVTMATDLSPVSQVERQQDDKDGARPPFNPFLPCKNYATGRWRSPVYSLRRQAELCKLAAQHGVESLLPYSQKLSWVREQRRVDQGGNRVKGTGVGQKVKGHIWERTMKSRLERRRIAMEGMPLLVREWKEKGHGRGWKKWPSGKAKK